MIIFGKIKDGQIIVQRFYRKDLEKNNGADVDIKIVKRTRTEQQNRYMWGVVYKVMGDDLGYTPDEVHEVCKQKFLSYEKKGHKFTKSTAELDLKEFAEYLEKVIRNANDLGIIIPDPDIIE